MSPEFFELLFVVTFVVGATLILSGQNVIYYTVSLLRQQVCLMRLRFERYFRAR